MTNEPGVVPAIVPVGTPMLGKNRSFWTVADQVVSSAQSLAIGLAVTHSIGLAGVGAFAVAYSGYQIIMVTNRPLNGDPLIVGFSSSARAARRGAAQAASGGAVLLGTVAMVLVVTVGLGLGGLLGPVLIAFGLSIPAFLLQDVWRCVFFMNGRPARAFANDLVVLFAMAPAYWLANNLTPGNAASLIGAWGAATLVGAVAGAVQSRAWPKVTASTMWWRSTLHFGAKILGENIVANFSYSIGIATIAVIAGESDLGRLRTAEVAAGIASPLVLAVAVIVLADGSRLLEQIPARFPKVVAIGGATTIAVGLGAALFWFFLPVHLGEILIGPTWPSSRPLVLGTASYVALVGVTTTLSAGLRTMRFPGVALRIRIWIAPFSLLGAVGGALVANAGGAIAGLSLAEAACAILLLYRFHSIWKGGAWRTQGPVYRAVSRP